MLFRPIEIFRDKSNIMRISFPKKGWSYRKVLDEHIFLKESQNQGLVLEIFKNQPFNLYKEKENILQNDGCMPAEVLISKYKALLWSLTYSKHGVTEYRWKLGNKKHTLFFTYGLSDDLSEKKKDEEYYEITEILHTIKLSSLTVE